MQNNKKSKWIITGISSGIGYELAKQLLESGHTVVGLVRDINLCNDLFEKYKKNIFLYKFDLNEIEKISQKITAILKEHNDIEYVISNAGISLKGEADIIDIDDICKLINTNLLGAMLYIREMIPHVKKCKGAIIQISSVSGEVCSPEWSYYCASKHGINGFLNSISMELKKYGVKVFVFEPGNVNTNLWKKLVDKSGYDEKIFLRSKNTDIDVKKLAREIITISLGKQEDIFYPMGSRAYKAIISQLEMKLKNYKKQEELAKKVDSFRNNPKKIIVPDNIGDRKIIIWSVGKNVKGVLKKSDWRNIDALLVGFIDSNVKIIGKYCLGRKIYEKEEILEKKENYYFVIGSTLFEEEIKENLEKYNLKEKKDFCFLRDIVKE